MLRTAAAIAAAVVLAAPGAAATKRPALAAEQRKLKVPPAWLASTPTSYDTNQPWKKARRDIRGLLGKAKYREAIKLTYIYMQKKDIGDGHEYPMYIYLGREFAWAELEYRRFVASGHTEPHTMKQLASIYLHYGEHKKALGVLNVALQHLPTNVWRTTRDADVNEALGDVYAQMGDAKRASQHYRKAMGLYPQSKQPWGRQNLPKRVAKAKAKMEILTLHTPEPGTLRDGSYKGSAIGYMGDVNTTVTVKGGKIADVKVSHRENIYGTAVIDMPKRIVAAQSLKVDCVTGATVTSQAILAGAHEALKQAGMTQAPRKAQPQDPVAF